MKSALFLAAAALSSVLGAIASPSTQGSQASSIAIPEGHNVVITEPSVDGTPKTAPVPAPAGAGVKDIAMAAATQYWICIAVSTSTGQYGWSQGGSESSALSTAKKNCQRGDCTYYACIDEGCVGIDYGSRSVAMSYARGYGSNDGIQAGNTALAQCKKQDTGCAKPGYFCSQRII